LVLGQCHREATKTQQPIEATFLYINNAGGEARGKKRDKTTKRKGGEKTVLVGSVPVGGGPGKKEGGPRKKEEKMKRKKKKKWGKSLRRHLDYLS